MQHLKPSRSRDHGFYYRSAATGEAVKAEIYYTKGGANFFTGGRTQRGIFVSLNPIKLSEDGFESFILGQGICACIEPMDRYNEKRLVAACERIDALIPEAAAKFTLETRREVIAELAAQYAEKIAA